ncbi:MAG: 4-hydroxythreonine-4-phosphate dehydrogenase PdxA [Prochlorococcus sp. SP3034]|nr:4-hydroxythreonine-4-phosphate dehydrogenase PdxA [Prochlorococcus sp. SP3034]|tara:strand:+ start:3005 stop:4060 length:1056 start_codon:yes stop_codon:yes gene_type:complete
MSLSLISSKNNYDKSLKIVISVGDESGIGPEVILKAMASNKYPRDIQTEIIGSKDNLLLTYKLLKSNGISDIANPLNLNIKDIKIKNILSNDSKTNFGNKSFHYLKHAIKIVQTTPNTCLVTGPICKKSWALAGHNYSGQTELLAESCNSSHVGMLFTAKSPITGWRFNTLLATTHIPLMRISEELNHDLIFTKLNLLRDFAKKFNQNISLKVAGLNPHAGEEGMLGAEEINLVEKSLSTWKLNNPDTSIEGPISPDSCWLSSAKAWNQKDSIKHDGILAMYHDQGLIPMKIIAANYSVNTTLGLTFIRTSPDHGTGFDIAGKGIAQYQSMLEAIKTARELSLNSSLLNSH